MSQTPPQTPDRDQRIATALEGVDLSALKSVDAVYYEKFPAEVSLHEFRSAVAKAMRDLEKKKPANPA